MHSSFSERHQALYSEVQESFVDNVLKAIRVGGGVTRDGTLRKVTKGTLAKRSNLSSGTITKLTSSETDNAKPDLETLCKLGCALNLSPAFLLMTARDWLLLTQAIDIIVSLRNPTGEREQELVQILQQGVGASSFEACVTAGLSFVEKLRSESYTTNERFRQQVGILAMTAIAQGAFRRQGSSPKMFATSLGAALGDREVS